MAVRPEFVHEYEQTHFHLERSALHLVSLLIADKELKRAYRSGALPNLKSFAEDEKESEIIRLVIEIATSFRLMYWNARSRPELGSVGTLCEDESSSLWGELKMLEACHKVIHAGFFAFETRKFPGTESHFMKPRIHLAGTKGKKDWLAVIDVLPFANAALQPIDPPFGR